MRIGAFARILLNYLALSSASGDSHSRQFTTALMVYCHPMKLTFRNPHFVTDMDEACEGFALFVKLFLYLIEVLNPLVLVKTQT